MAKKVQALDALSPEMAEKVDSLAYDFLKELGYDTEGAKEKYSVRNRLKKDLAKRGHALLYRALTNENMDLLFYYEMAKAGTEKSKKPEILFRSKAIKFVMKKPEESEKKEDDGANGE
jgi:hypothetical protein